MDFLLLWAHERPNFTSIQEPHKAVVLSLDVTQLATNLMKHKSSGCRGRERGGQANG